MSQYNIRKARALRGLSDPLPRNSVATPESNAEAIKFSEPLATQGLRPAKAYRTQAHYMIRVYIPDDQT